MRAPKIINTELKVSKNVGKRVEIVHEHVISNYTSSPAIPGGTHGGPMGRPSGPHPMAPQYKFECAPRPTHV